MSSHEGKVAFITGAARGQGRSHALRLARDGFDIVAVDICGQIESVPYTMSSKADLDETVAKVRELGRDATGVVADVRDFAALERAAAETEKRYGGIDVVLANAGISCLATESHSNSWQDTLDVNLTGVLNTLQATVPAMQRADRGGSVIITGSAWGLLSPPTDNEAGLAYATAKHAILGLMESYANLLVTQSIRVNVVHPCGTRTDMVWDFAKDEMHAGLLGFYTDVVPHDTRRNGMPGADMLEPSDVSNAISWLVSDQAKYVTGISLPVLAGFQLN